MSALRRLACRILRGHDFRYRKDQRGSIRGLVLRCRRCGQYGSTWA